LPAKCRWKRSKYKSGKEKKILGGFSLTTVVTAATKGGSEFRICVGWSDYDPVFISRYVCCSGL